jgi:hypothetical protein
MDYVRWVIGSRGPKTNEPAASTGVKPLSPQKARDLIASRMEVYDDGPALGHVRAESPRATALVVNLTSMAGDASLGELVYSLVRGLRPEVVIETGVAQGITSAYILAGLSDNGVGELHSIDLPSRAMIRSHLVGAAVPQDLRDRWTYHWGPSKRLLPPLLERIGPRLTLFVHDSDHRYANMRWELERAWAGAADGAWIVADDVELHSAFEDVAAAVGAEPLYVSQDAKPGWTGLMRKPTQPD